MQNQEHRFWISSYLLDFPLRVASTASFSMIHTHQSSSQTQVSRFDSCNRQCFYWCIFSKTLPSKYMNRTQWFQVWQEMQPSTWNHEFPDYSGMMLSSPCSDTPHIIVLVPVTMFQQLLNHFMRMPSDNATPVCNGHQPWCIIFLFTPENNLEEGDTQKRQRDFKAVIHFARARFSSEHTGLIFATTSTVLWTGYVTVCREKSPSENGILRH